MKIILFGIGKYYLKRKEKLNNFKNIEIIAMTDNNASLWNRKVDAIEVIPPDLIQNQAYDRIVIMSTYVREMSAQLLQIGIEKDKIITWEYFYKEQMQNNMNFFKTKASNEEESKRSILIITQTMEFDGGTLVAVHAARALKDRGVSVSLFAPDGNKNLINEIIDMGITVCTCMSLPYIFEPQREWIQKFDVVIVNLLTMMESAYEVVQFRPVLWWIHEASIIYASMNRKKAALEHKEYIDLINIYAVSRIAQQNFNREFDNRIKKILTAGIPDMIKLKHEEKKHNKVVFALIGNVHIIKLHHIFLKAAELMNVDQNAEFWIIGSVTDIDYGNYVKHIAFGISSARILGKLNMTDMQKAFEYIDVVVCASREETLSLTIIEGMMYGKVCITTKNTGIATYMQDGVNGYVISGNDAVALAEKMQYVLDNYDQLEDIRRAARKTYENQFSLKILGQNLEAALDETELRWKEHNQY